MTGRGYQSCSYAGLWVNDAPYCSPAQAKRQLTRDQVATIDLDPGQGNAVLEHLHTYLDKRN